MNRKTAIVLGFILLSLAASAQSIVPLPDCCPRIYDTGRWLGWAWAMLEHARDAGGCFGSPIGNDHLSRVLAVSNPNAAAMME